jgi:hypothetical protein
MSGTGSPFDDIVAMHKAKQAEAAEAAKKELAAKQAEDERRKTAAAAAKKTAENFYNSRILAITRKLRASLTNGGISSSDDGDIGGGDNLSGSFSRRFIIGDHQLTIAATYSPRGVAVSVLALERRQPKLVVFDDQRLFELISFQEDEAAQWCEENASNALRKILNIE